jgi:2-amino-4-hydroxy-6-hydroxymethyldihydropteridine diphosphokinase
MILIAIGANLESEFGPPRAACEEALRRLTAAGVVITACSPWYESAPVPIADQPWYVNGVAAVEAALSPMALLACLHAIEAEMGRVRSVVNAPRVIDLDLLAYGSEIIQPETIQDLCVPHPRLHQRAFVLLPLRDLAPQWQHPVSGRSVASLIADLPPDQEIRSMGALV